MVEVPYSTTATGQRCWYYVDQPIDNLWEAPPLAQANRQQWVVVVGPAPQLRFVMDASFEDGDMVICEDLRTQLAKKLPGYFQADRLYEDISDLNEAAQAAAPVALLTKTAALAAFNKSPHFVVMCGHGSTWGCLCPGGVLAPIVDKGLADAISTGFQTCIVYAKACYSGNFEDPGCIGSALVCHPGGAAVAFIGHSRTEFGATAPLLELFYDLTHGARHLGPALDTRLRSDDLLAIFELNLLGDPALQVRLDRDLSDIFR